MKLYRYSSVDKDEGFIQIAYNYDDSDDPITDKLSDEIFNLTWIFEVELNAPDVRIPEGTKFYFTEKGNRKFNEAIKKLNKFLSENNIATIDCKTIELESSENIIYQDTYQVAIYDRRFNDYPKKE